MGNIKDLVTVSETIINDLAYAQNHPDDLGYEVLRQFYDRMCTNVTDLEAILAKGKKRR